MSKSISKEKLLVNTLTALRLPFTVMGIFSLYHYGRSADCRWITLFAVISLAVYFSDFMDGRLARRWGLCSDGGAKLDLFCDSFYIFASLLAMIPLGASSPCILVLVSYKLLEFIVTSTIKRKFFTGATFFFYDKIGRILSALFYVSPPILLILHAMAPLYWKSILNGYTTLLAGLTVVSSWAKLENMKISFGCLVGMMRRESGSV